MAGGYGRDIADSVTVHENTLRAAIANWRAWQAGAETMKQCGDEHATAA